jgi:hypothetical protein
MAVLCFGPLLLVHQHQQQQHQPPSQSNSNNNNNNNNNNNICQWGLIQVAAISVPKLWSMWDNSQKTTSEAETNTVDSAGHYNRTNNQGAHDAEGKSSHKNKSKGAHDAEGKTRLKNNSKGAHGAEGKACHNNSEGAHDPSHSYGSHTCILGLDSLLLEYKYHSSTASCNHVCSASMPLASTIPNSIYRTVYIAYYYCHSLASDNASCTIE